MMSRLTAKLNKCILPFKRYVMEQITNYYQGTVLSGRGQHSVIEYYSCLPVNDLKGTVYESELLFIMEGTLFVSTPGEPEVEVADGSGILLIPGMEYSIRIPEELLLIIFRLDSGISIKEYFLVNEKQLQAVTEEKTIRTLSVNERLSSFLVSLREDCRKNIFDPLFIEIKTKELLFIFRNYYGREEMIRFLYPLLNESYSFTSFVYNNYHKVRSVQEFANLANQSVSAFCDKFKSIFGVTVYRWMMDKKNQAILYDLRTTTKLIKQIAEEQGFSSSPQFCDYCKKHFGKSANKIRQEGLKIHGESD